MNDNEKALLDHLITLNEALAKLQNMVTGHNARLIALEGAPHPGDVRTWAEAVFDAHDARITALENPPYPDDVRDALAALDELSGAEPTPWKPLKLDGFDEMPQVDADYPIVRLTKTGKWHIRLNSNETYCRRHIMPEHEDTRHLGKPTCRVCLYSYLYLHEGDQ